MTLRTLLQKKQEGLFPRVSEASTFYAVLYWSYIAILFIRASLDGILSLFRSEDGGFTIGALLNISIILLGLVCLVFAKRKLLTIPIVVWMPYLCLMCLSLYDTPDFSGGARLFMSVLTYPMIFAMGLVLTTNEQQLEVVLRTIVLSSIGPMIFVALQTSGYLSTSDGRISGTFGHANILAFYLVAVLLSLMYLGRLRQNNSPAMSLFLTLYALVTLVILILTEARGAWIGCVLLLVCYVIFANRYLLIFVPILPLVLFVPAISSRLSDLSDNSYSASADQVTSGTVVLNSYAWRQMLWSYAIADSESARILGKGVGSFRHNSPQFFPLQAADESGNGFDAHSVYVQTLYELGAFGLLFYLALYLGLIIMVVFIVPNASGAIMVSFILANLIFSYSDNVLYYLSFNWYFWGILGSVIGSRIRLFRHDRIERRIAAGPQLGSRKLRNTYYQSRKNKR